MKPAVALAALSALSMTLLLEPGPHPARPALKGRGKRRQRSKGAILHERLMVMARTNGRPW